MSNYENAPGTVLVATNCACCARPLLDAVSVETGVGPECRKKHGYDKPDQDLTLAEVVGLAAALTQADYLELTAGAPTTRELANRLVQRIAVDQSGPRVAHYVGALEALGFTTLAARVAKRLGGISVARVTIPQEATAFGHKAAHEVLRVVSPFSEAFVFGAKKIGGRAKKTGPKSWAWDFPAARRVDLWGLLKQSYAAGTPVKGDRGTCPL